MFYLINARSTRKLSTVESMLTVNFHLSLDLYYFYPTVFCAKIWCESLFICFPI